MTKNYLAIDLGGTSAKCALITDEKITTRWVIPTKIGAVFETIIEGSIVELKKLNIQSEDLDFIAITTCGLVDYDNKKIMWSGNLQLKDYDFYTVLQKGFKNHKVYFLNDAKAATYGEYKRGIKEVKQNMILYTIGTGIGGGLIINGQLIFGTNTKLASEPGHSGGFQDVYKCNCNLPGCIEGLSSATGIEKKINENINYFKDKLNIENKILTIKDISPLAKQNDKFTIELFKFCLEPLAKHIAVMLHTLDFDVVVIGGGPSKLGEPIINILKDLLKGLLLEPFYNNLDLRIAVLDNDAGIWGVYEWAKYQQKLNK